MGLSSGERTAPAECVGLQAQAQEARPATTSRIFTAWQGDLIGHSWEELFGCDLLCKLTLCCTDGTLLTYQSASTLAKALQIALSSRPESASPRMNHSLSPTFCSSSLRARSAMRCMRRSCADRSRSSCAALSGTDASPRKPSCAASSPFSSASSSASSSSSSAQSAQAA